MCYGFAILRKNRIGVPNLTLQGVPNIHGYATVTPPMKVICVRHYRHNHSLFPDLQKNLDYQQQLGRGEMDGDTYYCFGQKGTVWCPCTQAEDAATSSPGEFT
ncbi:hypothetical protein TNCV_3393821 [Trichonephila clavipes]|nr:hypothetical protein TNCV_3393821 [Trichonephila clavipes]